MTLDAIRWQSNSSLFYPWIALLLMGWLMVASASTGIAEDYTGNPAYFAIRHAIYLAAGIAVAFATSQISMARWAKFDGLLLVLGILGLILVFVPGIGHEVNGSQRWLNLGIIKIQASELAKVGAVFYVAGYLVRREHEVKSQWSGFLKPLAILGAMVGLLLMEPDFGAVVVLLGAAMIMLFLGGVKAGQFFLLTFATIVIGVLVVGSEDYRVNRLLAYLNPWAPEHVYGTGYQLTQSLIAFGRGELFGVGFGESVQKLFYLPEAHTDFVFAIWAEETGLFGGLVALGLLAYLVSRIWHVSWEAQKQGLMYASYVATGLAALLGLQIVINLGVNTGLLPTKGLTLPFFSYGGSSLMMCCAMVGIVMRVAYETEQAKAENTELADSSKSKNKEDGDE